MILEYSEEWPDKYSREAELIKKVLGADIIDIQHIGSTSIPGLSAKPIIDIAVLVSSIEDTPHFSELLKKIDYDYKPDMSSGERIFLRKGNPVEYHLSIACHLHTFWERQILFRDYLKLHPDYLKEYQELKKEAVKDLPKEDFVDLSRSKGYSSKKGPFIEKVLKLAREEKFNVNTQQPKDIKTEKFSLEPNNPAWRDIFNTEKQFLIKVLPSELIGKIEHIGSTAIKGIKAKPIVDILMEVKSQEKAKNIIAPILANHGYEHILHNGLTHDEPKESSWFIKRNENGERVAHIWCAEPNTLIWNRVLFVKYLNTNPEVAKEYENLKLDLLSKFPSDRRQYLSGKSNFIDRVTELAIKEGLKDSN